MEKRQNEVIEIDLLELFYALKKQILWIILAAIVGGTLAFAGTKLLMTPMYESTTTMLVLTKETTLSSLADLQMGTQLTNDYEILTVSRQVLERVIDDLNLDMEYEDLKENVQIRQPDHGDYRDVSEPEDGQGDRGRYRSCDLGIHRRQDGGRSPEDHRRGRSAGS